MCSRQYDHRCKYALNLLKSSDLVLKREQKEALHAVCVEKRDCLCVLPTGFGKSLIFQLDPSTLDYLTKVNNSCVLVVSPLNAIISDQIEKLESRGIGVKVFKQRYQGVVTTIDDDVKFIYFFLFYFIFFLINRDLYCHYITYNTFTTKFKVTKNYN